VGQGEDNMSDDPDESRRLARIRDNQADVNIMIAKNKEELRSTGRRFYAGFRLVKTAVKPTPEEEPYIGAFLPLDVAKEHPQLLGLPTLHYQTVYHNEKRKRAIRIIAAPGVFTKSINRKKIWLLAFISCAILGALIYAAMVWQLSR
jgi:hypothetical protein